MKSKLTKWLRTIKLKAFVNVNAKGIKDGLESTHFGDIVSLWNIYNTRMYFKWGSAGGGGRFGFLKHFHVDGIHHGVDIF